MFLLAIIILALGYVAHSIASSADAFVVLVILFSEITLLTYRKKIN